MVAANLNLNNLTVLLVVLLPIGCLPVTRPEESSRPGFNVMSVNGHDSFAIKIGSLLMTNLHCCGPP